MKRFAFLLALILCLAAGTSYAWENKLAWSFKPEMRTAGGRKVLAARRAKGRKILSA